MPLILSSNSKTPLAVTGAASVTLEALRGLSPDTLASEITRVQNSVAHLRRSNDEMEALASGMGEESEGLDESDRRELKVACEENDGVVARQEALISRLTTVLAEKTGVDPNNPHYALNAADSTPRMASTGLLAPGAVPGSRPAEGVRSDVSADLNQRARGVLSGVEVQGSRLARPGNTEQGQDEPGVFL